MAARLITGVINRLLEEFADIPGLQVWDGEVPRQNTDGTAVTVPQGFPTQFPVVRVAITEAGVSREWQFENTYCDMGDTLNVILWDVTREQVEDYLDRVEALFAKNWGEIDVGSGYDVFHLLLLRWWSGQEEGVRVRTGQLLYRAELQYEFKINGAIQTRGV